jgi:hypothetical protein
VPLTCPASGRTRPPLDFEATQSRKEAIAAATNSLRSSLQIERYSTDTMPTPRVQVSRVGNQSRPRPTDRLPSLAHRGPPPWFAPGGPGAAQRAGPVAGAVQRFTKPPCLWDLRWKAGRPWCLPCRKAPPARRPSLSRTDKAAQPGKGIRGCQRERPPRTSGLDRAGLTLDRAGTKSRHFLPVGPGRSVGSNRTEPSIRPEGSPIRKVPGGADAAF